MGSATQSSYGYWDEFQVSDIKVHIVKLEYMRVASIWGFGEEPEGIAFAKLEVWAEPRGIRENPEKS